MVSLKKHQWNDGPIKERYDTIKCLKWSNWNADEEIMNEQVIWAISCELNEHLTGILSWPITALLEWAALNSQRRGEESGGEERRRERKRGEENLLYATHMVQHLHLYLLLKWNRVPFLVFKTTRQLLCKSVHSIYFINKHFINFEHFGKVCRVPKV